MDKIGHLNAVNADWIVGPWTYPHPSGASTGLSKHGTLSDRRFPDFQRAYARRGGGGRATLHQHGHWEAGMAGACPVLLSSLPRVHIFCDPSKDPQFPRRHAIGLWGLFGPKPQRVPDKVKVGFGGRI